MEDPIAAAAFVLGFVQLYQQGMTAKDIDVSMKYTIILSLVTSILWFVYQYKQNGINMTSFYTLSGLIIQLYLLNIILLKEKDRILSRNEPSD